MLSQQPAPAITHFCRICRAPSSSTNTLRDLNVSLIKKLISIYPRLLVSPFKNISLLPVEDFICSNCYLSLEIAYEFQLKVHKSESALWKRVLNTLPKYSQLKEVKPELIIVGQYSDELLNEDTNHFDCGYEESSVKPQEPAAVATPSKRDQKDQGSHLQCHLCGFVTNRHFNLNRHNQQKHPGERDLKVERNDGNRNLTTGCDLKPFEGIKTELEGNEAEVTSESQGSKAQTKTLTEKPPKPKRRRKLNKEEKGFTCHLCDYHSPRSYNIKRHLYFVHRIEEDDNKKQKNLSNDELGQHLEVADNEEITTEDLNETSESSTQPDTQTHEITLTTGPIRLVPLQNVGPIEFKQQPEENKYYKKIYTCFICKKTFNRSNNYQKHLRANGCALWLAKKPELACDYCGKNFLTPLTRTRHIKNVHLGDDPRRFVCKLCNVTIKRRSHLKRHFQVFHIGEEVVYEIVLAKQKKQLTDILAEVKTFNCQRCPKTFLCRTELRDHSKIVHQKESFKCDICSRTFKYHREIEKHMMVHSSEHFLLCPICGMSFKKQMLFNAHLKTHH